ncbi:hypothetical protein HME01_11280 [Vreelandella aquamarina]|uniref:DUF6950 domain-containing protein n=1 Tax=Vreelandella aquamarina TaxID=77097 RepID=A0A1N6HP30_9GAMM|nr:hypothetical protein [Halomonas meridiana]GED45276.1 hypothetical protein HME01_11280 [Halomonas meridiana]SIN62308.1 hypothetical protein SAMN05878438_0847 [Halomonas meridiana]SIN72227.1 hypothetical protein SAMN05878249_3064 [Halomonas meridiana]SIO21435.1 hypothetical protein SAMN05878442_1540 [Halomonas meridiana]
MPRYRDWTTQLHHVIQAASERPFSWGEFDCCLFTADCCIAICGIDPAEKYRGRYTTEIGAKRVLRNTHGSLEGAWDACFKRVPVAMRQRGDVVLFDSENGRCVGVVWANAIWAVTDDGVHRVRAEPLICWSVGNE